MTGINATSFYTTNMLAVPGDGPRSVPLTLDFSLDTQFTTNLQNFVQTNKISLIQSVFIDNSANAAPFSMQSQPGGQIITVPPNSQAYLMLLSPNPPTFTFSSTGGVVVKVMLNNFPVANAVWKTV